MPNEEPTLTYVAKALEDASIEQLIVELENRSSTAVIMHVPIAQRSNGIMMHGFAYKGDWHSALGLCEMGCLRLRDGYHKARLENDGG